MRRHWQRKVGVVGAIAAAVAMAACGGDNSSNPAQSPLVITKAQTKSGDQQTGRPGEALPAALRVVVTRDGEPVADVPVTWGTGSGSVSPRQGSTATDGLTTGAWTLGDVLGTQTATASVTAATNSPIIFTATATDDPIDATSLVHVLGGGSTGANRFEPAEITVTIGTTVTWEWADGAVGHNVVPDAGDTPAPSGPPADSPTTYHYTFNTLGTYRYHCQTHGGLNGFGMSGTVNVVTNAP
jgi:plastocyanin